ncbi:MAG: hypothetical protein RSD44_09130, partial [Akkermansia sp.]
MKLHLPTVLLHAVLACIIQSPLAATATTPTINLNTHDWNQYISEQGTPECPYFEDVNMTLNGDWEVDLKKFIGLIWGSSDNGNYTLTGTGTMDFHNEGFSLTGGGSKGYSSGNTHYTIGEKIILKNGFLEAGLGAQVTFNGSISPSTNPLTPCEFGVYSPDEKFLSSLDLTHATIRDNDHVLLDFQGGTIILDQYTVTKTHSLEISRTVGYFSKVATKSVFQGNLILADGGEVFLFANCIEGEQYKDVNLSITG